MSYRRTDAAGVSGRIYDRLVDEFGKDEVFFDVDAIKPGLDFVEILDETLQQTNVMLTVIGKRWLKEGETNRLHDPYDFVRLEIEAALGRNIRIFPVLVDGAAMPRAADLPDTVKMLARRHAHDLAHTRFDTDCRELIGAIDRALRQDHLIISDTFDRTGPRWHQEFARMVPLLQRGQHYVSDGRQWTVGLTARGVAFVEDQLGLDDLFESVNTPLVGYLVNALAANALLVKDRDYVVRLGRVNVVDRSGGAILDDYVFDQGIQQAVEAKEGVQVSTT